MPSELIDESTHHCADAHLPVRTRRAFDGEGNVTVTETVFCPSRGGSVSLDTCLGCSSCSRAPAHGEAALICLHPAARRASRPSRPVRFPSASELTALTAIMTRDVICVRADLAIESLAALLIEQNISATPVVDERGHAVGMVTKSDLVRWYHEDADLGAIADLGELAACGDDDLEPGLGRRRVEVPTVRDIMTSMAFSLTEDAPVAYAAALIAVEGVHHLAVTTGTGEVVGIVSAVDIVRWLAHSDGFVIPPAR